MMTYKMYLGLGPILFWIWISSLLVFIYIQWNRISVMSRRMRIDYHNEISNLEMDIENLRMEIEKDKVWIRIVQCLSIWILFLFDYYMSNCL